MSARINHLAVIVAAIAFFAWGAVWFMSLSGPWHAALGTAPYPMSSMGLIFCLSFLCGLALAYATAIALGRHPEDLTVKQGVSFALFMGLFVYVIMTVNQNLYEGRSWTLIAIDGGYLLIGFAIIGAIVGGWKKKAA